MKRSKKRMLGILLVVMVIVGIFFVVILPQIQLNKFAHLGEYRLPGLLSEGEVLLPNRWVLTPVGDQIQVGDLPLGMTLSPDGKLLAVTNNGWGNQFVSIIDTTLGSEIQRLPLERSFYGIAFSSDGKRLYVSGGGSNRILVYDFRGSRFIKSSSIVLGPKNKDIFPCGLAVSSKGKKLFVANNLENVLAIIDLASKKIRNVPVGVFPYGVEVSKDGSKVYVSNWGSGSISILDTRKKEVIDTIRVGDHPNDLLLNPDGRKLYVANANTDDVSVIDTRTNKIIETISLQPYPGAPFGSTPNALGVSPDGKRLYVANADNNDIAVIEISKEKSEVIGLIPVGWYPTALEISPDGKKLYVADGKGLSSKPNPEGPNPYQERTNFKTQYIAGLFLGTVSVIDIPSKEKLAEYTAQVEENNGFSEVKGEKLYEENKIHPLPRRIGKVPPIKHVIYIIKENRAYDQVFGDLPQGNGDPNICLFGREITPNHHALTEEFTLLDNFYVDAEVSADGHEWSCAAIATDFVEKTWPTVYSNRGRSYPSEGVCPAAYPTTGYLWDTAAREGITYRSYGEFIHIDRSKPDQHAYTNMKNLKGHFDPLFRPWDLDYPDTMRATEFIRELKSYEESGNLPQLIIMRLPNDHNYGTTPGKPTPRAMMADNDLALGMVVDAVSHSKYWKDTAIFVVEDDTQNGPDHVDCHRTVAFVISPWVKRGEVDHTMYDTCSMLKTIELILGLPPMGQYDAIAIPMLNCFQKKPDLTPYNLLQNTYPLDEKNPEDAYGAKECLAMDFKHIDATPMLRHNEIVWKSIRGIDSKMPAPITHRIWMGVDED
jgi:YVTN family beta-propeller protein